MKTRLTPTQLREIRGSIDLALHTLTQWPDKLAHITGAMSERAEGAVSALREHCYPRVDRLLAECVTKERVHSPIKGSPWAKALATLRRHHKQTEAHPLPERITPDERTTGPAKPLPDRGLPKHERTAADPDLHDALAATPTSDSTALVEHDEPIPEAIPDTQHIETVPASDQAGTGDRAMDDQADHPRPKEDTMTKNETKLDPKITVDRIAKLREAGWTMRAIADAIKRPAPSLGNEISGQRPIQRATAEAIAALPLEPPPGATTKRIVAKTAPLPKAPPVAVVAAPVLSKLAQLVALLDEEIVVLESQARELQVEIEAHRSMRAKWARKAGL
jgi:hypothetical protein